MMETVRKLRELTGAGVMDCKKALADAQGDLERAQQFLKQKGLLKAEEKSARSARQGLIGSYLHFGGKIGVLVEVNCETDFVARTEIFQSFVKDVAMQIAAANPRFVSREDVPKELTEEEKTRGGGELKERSHEAHVERAGDPLETWFQEICLWEQKFIKDEAKTIKEYLNEVIAKTGENVVIRRFVRYALGEIDGE